LTEEKFIKRFLLPLDVQVDYFGNLYKVIGDSPIMWSCHTDTVHWMDGHQLVGADGDWAYLADEERISNCLGADCTTGVWIMTEMIRAGVPGLYVFHREEESGGHGSDFFAKTQTKLLSNIKIAIAFDRRARNSVITHQFGRCCSTKFANSLADQLTGYQKDNSGVFTDTANYTHLIPECTNVSVGYFREHSASECQDLRHMQELLDMMIKLDQSKLVVDRDPNEVDNDYDWRGGYLSYGSSYSIWDDVDDDDREWRRPSLVGGNSFLSGNGKSNRKNRGRGRKSSSFSANLYSSNSREALIEFISANPEVVADLLDQYGITFLDLENYLYAA